MIKCKDHSEMSSEHFAADPFHTDSFMEVLDLALSEHGLQIKYHDPMNSAYVDFEIVDITE